MKYLVLAIALLATPCVAVAQTPLQQQNALVATINQLTTQLIQVNAQNQMLAEALRAAQTPTATLTPTPSPDTAKTPQEKTN